MKNHLAFIITVVILFLAASCDQIPTYPVNQDAEIAAAIAQTADVELTALAFTPEQFSTATVIVEETLQPTEVPLATPVNTPTHDYRDIALLMGILSVGDGTEVFPNERFDVVWRIRNVGETDWSGDYNLVMVSGESMGVLETISLNTKVAIGEIIELRLKMTAPEALGDYSALWLLQNPEGELFGMDDAGEKPLQVNVTVIENPLRATRQQVLTFYENFSTAEWYTQNGIALCEVDGNVGEYGMVYRDNDPEIQNGVIENEPSIVMIPAEGENGYVAGKYPPFVVKAGDYFVTYIGCLDEGSLCDVTFRLDYQVSGEDEIQTVGEWKQTHNGRWQEIRKNLTKLDGLEVQFILVVENNGLSKGDFAVWFVPSIYR